MRPVKKNWFRGETAAPTMTKSPLSIGRQDLGNVPQLRPHHCHWDIADDAQLFPVSCKISSTLLRPEPPLDSMVTVHTQSASPSTWGLH